jgi:integrase
MAEDAKPAYYNNKLVYLKTFFSWCVDESILPDNPLKSIKRKKADSRIVDVNNKSLKELLSILNQKTYTGLRDFALLLLQLDTGIRPKEALSLQVSDVNFRSLEVYIKAENAKTRIARTLPLSPITAKAIQKLINARPSEWDAKIPVFCTFDGRKWSVNGWYKQLSSHGNKIGIRVFPYQLRHTFALEFLRNGGNSFALQKTMGHTDLNMTKRYVALADEDVKEQHTKASPVSNLIELKKRIVKISKHHKK